MREIIAACGGSPAKARARDFGPDRGGQAQADSIGLRRVWPTTGRAERPARSPRDFRHRLLSAAAARFFRRPPAQALLIFITVFAPLSPRALADQPATQPTTDQSQSTIAALADPDPAAANRAAAQVRSNPNVYRPQLVVAAQSDDPMLAPAAAALLLDLPWDQSGDPPAAADILRVYGKAEHKTLDRRENDCTTLGSLPADQGVPALLRILQEDPSTDVAWAAHSVILNHWNPTLADHVRHLDLDNPAARAPALALAASAWIDIDRPRALDCLRRAIQDQARAPADDLGGLAFAYDLLASDALLHNHPDVALAVRRLECDQVDLDEHPAVGQVLALHAQFPLLPGLDQDLRQYGPHIGDPQAFIALSHIEQSHGRGLVAQSLRFCAFIAPFQTDNLGERFAFFCLDQGWQLDARRAEYQVLNRRVAKPDSYDISALIALARLDVADGNESAVADDEEVALALLPGSAATLTFGGAAVNSPQDVNDRLRADIAIHRKRAAEQRGDTAEVQRQLRLLVQLSPKDPELVIELAPDLQAAGHTADARRLFDAAYAELAQHLAHSADPTERAEAQNDLAWLCARCDQRLPEALTLAQHAVAADPNNAAFLDTLAEATFRNGAPARAVTLEQKALAQHPDDTFMKQQLTRFRAGASSKPTTKAAAN